MSSPATSTAALTPKNSTPGSGTNLISLIFTVGGILTVIISLVLQFALVNNGPSGHNVIMTNMRSYGASIATGIVCIGIGLVMWLVLYQTSKAYIWLFIITWISFLLANMAVMFSLYQVELKKQ
jgi:hypothetical protein